MKFGGEFFAWYLYLLAKRRFLFGNHHFQVPRRLLWCPHSGGLPVKDVKRRCSGKHKNKSNKAPKHETWKWIVIQWFHWKISLGGWLNVCSIILWSFYYLGRYDPIWQNKTHVLIAWLNPPYILIAKPIADLTGLIVCFCGGTNFPKKITWWTIVDDSWYRHQHVFKKQHRFFPFWDTSISFCSYELFVNIVSTLKDGVDRKIDSPERNPKR